VENHKRVGFLYRNGYGMETALACAAAGISGVAGVGAASMKGYGGYGQAAKCFTNRLETAKMDANLCPLLFCPNLCRSSSRLKS